MDYKHTLTIIGLAMMVIGFIGMPFGLLFRKKKTRIALRWIVIFTIIGSCGILIVGSFSDLLSGPRTSFSWIKLYNTVKLEYGF